MQAAFNFLDAAKMHYMQLMLELFLGIELLTKFANHTHHFLHGIPILQDAKNQSQHEEKFEARQRKNFLQGR